MNEKRGAYLHGYEDELELVKLWALSNPESQALFAPVRAAGNTPTDKIQIRGGFGTKPYDELTFDEYNAADAILYMD